MNEEVVFHPGAATFPQNTAVFVSGAGTNLQALLTYLSPKKVRFCGVFCSDEGAPAATVARAHHLPVELPPAGFHQLSIQERDRYLIRLLQEWKTEWLLLAGYRRLIGPDLLAAFPWRVLNIHPSLLPSFPGLEAQSQAWEHGVRVSGCTVHFVDDELDHGPIIDQEAVLVSGLETSDALKEKILQAEHRLYSRAFTTVLERGCRVNGRRVEFDL